jgi:hypothetical protein
MGDAWKPSKLQRCFVNRGGLDRKLFLIYLALKGLIKNKSHSWICDINIEVRTKASEAVTLISLIMKFPRLIKEKLFISVCLKICVQREIYNGQATGR